MSPPAFKWFDAFELDGQRYERIGEEPYTRRDGRMTTVALWQSICRACHQPWQFIRSDKPVPTGPPRQCKSCAAKQREAKARLNQTGQYSKPNALPSVSAPFIPAWMTDAIETEHEAPHAAPLAPIAAVEPLAAAQSAPVRPPNPSSGGKRKGVFTDR